MDFRFIRTGYMYYDIWINGMNFKLQNLNFTSKDYFYRFKNRVESWRIKKSVS